MCCVSLALFLPSPGKTSSGLIHLGKGHQKFSKTCQEFTFEWVWTGGHGECQPSPVLRVPRTRWNHARARPPDAKTQRQRMVPRLGWSLALG